MNKFIIAISLIIISHIAMAQNNATTYYLIRHAEKERANPDDKNPSLTEEGLQRAEKWASVLKNIKFDAVYSTNYTRTLQTGKPLADANNIPIKLYNPRFLFTDEFKNETQGKTVLIVGHSNTTPFFANKIIGTRKYEEMDDLNYSNLYIITLNKNVVTDTLLYIN